MITIRASSLSELFDCPARWESIHVRGMYIPKTGVAQLGTAIHASTAAFDACALAGAPITPDEAAGAAVDAIYKPETDVVWGDMKPAAAEKVARALNARYCSEIAPGQNYIAVELNCGRLEIADLGIAFTGTTDRIRRTAEYGLGVTDVKTGATAVEASGIVRTAGHMAQLGIYELIASQAIGRPMTEPAQVIGMQTGRTSKAQRIECALVPTTQLALIGDESMPGLIDYAAGVVNSGLFYGNPRSLLCSVKYCPAYGLCRFRG